MKIETIKDQPVDIKNIKPRTRKNGATRERTVGFNLTLNYGESILAMLSMDGQAYDLKGLWNEEGIPVPGIKRVQFDREFDRYLLVFRRNRKAMLTINAETLHSFEVAPIADGNFEVEFQALCVCSDGDTERLHKLLKDPGICLSIEAAEGGQGEL